ncbi:MAG: ASPIC/UnbV domain-containing protein, partial [Acidobacteriia bacterium]|nr:ASPIC/UnbV domain-containing protein [Terriglobia bacterium]
FALAGLSACRKPLEKIVPYVRKPEEIQPGIANYYATTVGVGLGALGLVVKSASSYLSQSELALTFGLAKRDRVDRVVIAWPSSRVEEFKNLAAGRLWECTEGKGVRDTGRF